MQVKGRSNGIVSSLSLCRWKRTSALLSFVYGVLEAMVIGGGIGFLAAYGFADEPANFFEYPLVGSISGAVIAVLNAIRQDEPETHV